MVIENLNKYSEEQIASLQEKENVIRLIISEQPNRCNLEHLRKYAIKSDTNIQLCLCAEDIICIYNWLLLNSLQVISRKYGRSL